jgi:redox-sensitive bicupin YhaK (pirin superfamily)
MASGCSRTAIWKLRHADSLGTNAIVRQGDVMRLSAGTGVLHSEFNASDRDALHLMQVWLTPERSRLVPSYQQRAFTPADRQRGLVLVASRDGRNGSITIHQDVAIYSARLGRGEVITLGLAAARHVWVQMLRGSAQLNGVTLKAGDGAAAAIESLELRSLSDSETLLFDLA